ncbi:MAG: hypothetical protein QGH76_01650 [Phycisphaerales bacterium]|jgi:DNA-binding response OmpR family regulator|nr:hypothetical protein [Phycisphaerales bacterium]
MDNIDQSIQDALRDATPRGAVRILLIGEASDKTTALRAALEVAGHGVVQGGSFRAAEVAFSQEAFNAVLVDGDAPSADWRGVADLVATADPDLPVIVFTGSSSQDIVVDALRDGVVDVFRLPRDLAVATDRVSAILEESDARRSQNERCTRIETACNDINEERHRVAAQVDALTGDLNEAYADIEQQMKNVAMGAEFRTLIGQELDIESMLRTSLEYMLQRLGSTNAAIFLREGDVDWGVGAYVNYDRQGEDYLQLVEELGAAVCQPMASEHELVRYSDGEEFARWAQLDEELLSDSDIVAFACFDGSRCVAVVVLFRSNTRPFDDEAAMIMDVLRKIFGDQIGKILKIHRRATSEWPAESVDESDDDDWTLGRAA